MYVSKIIQIVKDPKFKNRVIVILLIGLIVCLAYLFYVSNENETRKEQAINNFFQYFEEESNFILDTTSGVIENFPSEGLDIDLLKIERGLSKLDGILNSGNRIFIEYDEYVANSPTFPSLSRLATTELENYEETLTFVRAVDDALLYVLNEIESLKLNNALDIQEFNTVIHNATQKFLEDMDLK